MTIDINNPDYAKALKEYESALYDATVEFERAKRNAQNKFHDELRRIAEDAEIAEQPHKEFTVRDMEDAKLAGKVLAKPLTPKQREMLTNYKSWRNSIYRVIEL